MLGRRSLYKLKKNMKIKGKVTGETVVESVGANEVWKVYGGRELGDVVCELMNDQFASVQLLEGDGGVGSILQINYQPGGLSVGYHKEIFTKIDDINRVKEVEIIEGGFKSLGVDVYRIRLEIMEKSEDDESTIIRSTIEYEMDEQFANVAALINTNQFQLFAEKVGKYLADQKKKASA